MQHARHGRNYGKPYVHMPQFKNKGTDTRTGSAMNYVFAGFMVAVTKDTGASTEDQEKVTTAMLEKLDDGKGKLDMSKAEQLSSIVGHAQVVKAKKCSYVSYRLHEGHDDLARILNRAFLRAGKRQTDPPPPKPVSRDLRQKWLDTKSK